MPRDTPDASGPETRRRPVWYLTRDPVFLWGLVGVALLFALGPYLPIGSRLVQVRAAPGYGPECGSGGRTEVVEHLDGRKVIDVRRGRCHLEVEMRGDVELDGDLTGVGEMSRGALLEIRERVGRDRRQLVARAGDGGRAEYTWYVDGEVREMDDEARAWMAEVFLRILRATGLQAERRVAGLFAEQGVDGVLAELREIPTDHVRRLYLEALLGEDERSEDLSDEDLARVLARAGRDIGSDYELARMLAKVPGRRLVAGTVQQAYIQAARSVGSDYEMRRALEVLLENDLEPEAAGALVEIAGRIGSDYELAELLVDLAQTWRPDAPLPARFVDALDSIGSDHEHRRVLSAALSRSLGDPETLERLLESALDVGSDYELAELLIEVTGSLDRDRALPAAFFEAADTIGTDFEQARVLATVVERRGSDPETLERVLETARGVGSDYELASLLIELAERHPVGPDLHEPFERALASVGSDYENRRVRQALQEKAAPGLQ